MALVTTFQTALAVGVSLPASGTSPAYALDATTPGTVGANLYCEITAGTAVSANATVTFTVQEWDGSAYMTTGRPFQITTPAATLLATLVNSIALIQAKYQIIVTNQDVTNAVTFTIRYSTIAQ